MNNNDFCIVNGDKIQIFKNNEESLAFRINIEIEYITGGPLLGVFGNSMLIFYDWRTGQIIRKIETQTKQIIWNEAGTHLAIIEEDKFYILYYNNEEVIQYLLNTPKNELAEEGIDTSFDIIAEIDSKINSYCWASSCFV